MIKKSILATVLTLAAMVLITSTSQAAEIKAANVSSVRYQDPDTGQLVQINCNHLVADRSEWQEHSPNGVFIFKVAARDEWTVYLYDANRQISMTIDLHQKKLTWGTGPNKGQPTSIIGTYAIHSFQ
ncbi:MAG: hypothetical protein P1U89_26875 [Verrucomicrobiales bacterium]|nr:hypothetical protein [Verrucomicrobiales bacterium]